MVKRLASNPVFYLWLIMAAALTYGEVAPNARGGYVASPWIETHTVSTDDSPAAPTPQRAFPPVYVDTFIADGVVTLRWGDVAHSEGPTLFTVQRMTFQGGQWVDTMTRDVGHSLNFIDTPPAGTHFYRVRSVVLE